jgi:hypothetical protein
MQAAVCSLTRGDPSVLAEIRRRLNGTLKKEVKKYSCPIRPMKVCRGSGGMEPLILNFGTSLR